MRKRTLIIKALSLLGLLIEICNPVRSSAQAADSFEPLSAGRIPTNLTELWGEYDPRKEPLDVDITKSWEEEGVTLRILRFTVGTFKGVPARITAIYGFPKSDQKLPAILDLHGANDSASLEAVRFAAHHGYAALSINWGGNRIRLGAEDYQGPNTDWGAVDATHPQKKSPTNLFLSTAPNGFTLDSVDSPRNSAWFLCLVAARRALTFLEQQLEVDGERIGVQGHSMGAKTATQICGIDTRVKAAVPSRGGAGELLMSQRDIPGGDRTNPGEMALQCLSENAYLDRITRPLLYLSPSNDFDSVFDNMAYNWRNFSTEQFRMSVTPHAAYWNAPEFEITQLLWFEEHLKSSALFRMPKTPKFTADLRTGGGGTVVTVTPDTSWPPLAGVDVFYSTDPDFKTRFWRDAEPQRKGSVWTAECPILSTDEPLFIYANVHYELPLKYRTEGGPKTFAISSYPLTFNSQRLKLVGVKPLDKPSMLIDDGTRGWKDWYRKTWSHPLWKATTRKIHDPKWQGPNGAQLAFEILSTADNTLVVSLRNNGSGSDESAFAGEYFCEKKLAASEDWQTVTLDLGDFLPARKDQSPLRVWRFVTELSLGSDGESAYKNGVRVDLGGKEWKGPREFRNLRWFPSPDAIQAPQLADFKPKLGPVASFSGPALTPSTDFTIPPAQAVEGKLPTVENRIDEIGGQLARKSLDSGPKQGVSTPFGFQDKTPGTLAGSFFDLKRTRNGDPTDMLLREFREVFRRFVREGWKQEILEKYAKSPNELYATQFFIPDVEASQGPKAFGIQNGEEGRWLALYKGRIAPPEDGTYYFVGGGHDVLVVRVNGKVVLDRCWNDQYRNTKDWQADQNYNYAVTKLPNGLAKGDPMRMKADQFYDIEVLIGEEAGKTMFAWLLVEQSGKVYQKDPLGNPILPIFRTADIPIPELDPGQSLPPYQPDGPLWRALPPQSKERNSLDSIFGPK